MRRIYGIIAFATTFLFTVDGVKGADWYLSPFAFSIDFTGSWNSNPDGLSGSSPSSFSNSGDVWHFTNSSSYDVSFETFNIPAASIASVHAGFNLIVSGGALVGNFAIDVANGGTMTISNGSNNYHFRTLGPSSTVVFNTSNYTVKVSSSHASPIIYGNIRLTTNNSVSGRLSTLYCNGVITIDANRTFSLNANNLTCGSTIGNFAGTGNIYADTSRITLQGGNGGNNGTLNLHPSGNRLNLLYIQYSSPLNFITLGSNIEILHNPNGQSGMTIGRIVHAIGRIDLNGHTINTGANSDVSFATANALVQGDINSSLIINGSTGLTAGGRTLRMQNNNNLRALVLNNASATLTVGTSLVIHDSLAVPDGVLATNSLVTIETTNTQKGRISRVGGGITGDVTVRTTISGGSTGWMHMGVSGVGNQTVADWDTYYSSGGTNGIPMTCVGCNFAPNAFNPTFHSIQGWVEATDSYDTTLTSNTSLPLGKGFWVYVGDGTTNTGDLTLVNTGPIHTGLLGVPLSVTGSKTEYWNLVANPYVSPISWEKVFDLTEDFFPGSLNSEMHIFSPDNGYVTNVAGVGGTASDIIPMGQGFYVAATSSAVNILFDEVVKMDDNTTNLNRAGTKSDRQYFKLQISGAYGNDITMLNFDQRATTLFDKRYDGHKLFTSAGYSGYGHSYSKYTTISTKDAEGTDYAVNSLPVLTSSMSIPLLTRVMATGTHSISVNEKVNFDGCLILHDKLNGKYHDLNTAPYIFQISDTTSTPRFDLILCQTESGPVLSVDELQKENNVLIGQDANGAYVRTHFKQNTKATISAFNIVGQQLIKDMPIEGTETFTHLPLNVSNQVVIIRVTTPNETVVKKIIAH